ncbi:unnamed protein product [Dicrocoelium dendriticum]|nr:unnamed protein product [Dicrocoelium dendriticum]
MKESGTLSHSKKYMGHSLRKSTLMLGSRVSSCVSKRSDTEKRPSRPTIRLIDQNGLDLTPLPLLTDDKRFRDDRETSNDCTASIHSGSSLHITNPFAFTRSLVSVSSPTGDSRSEASDDNVERYHAYTEIKTLIQPQHEELSEADLNKLVDIKIAETDTFWIFDQPPTVLSQDSEDALQQIKRNTAYKALVTGRLGNDRYMERGMNTFNCPVIAKSVQTSRIAMHERSTMVTVWEMADTFQAELTDEEPQMPEAVSPVEQVRKTKSVSQSPLLQPDDGGPIEPSKVPVLKDFTVTTEPGSVAGTSEGSRLGTSITPKDTMVSNSESDLFGFRYSVSSQPSILTGALDILAVSFLLYNKIHFVPFCFTFIASGMGG